jgi:ATP-binding cassette subfamily F protein 3
MPLVSASNIRFSIGTHVILDGATLSIEPGERIGLVGKNGAGKTTLMRVMTGELKPDSGSIVLQRGSKIGYLKQDPDLDPTLTLREEAGEAFVDLARLHKELDTVFHEMETAAAPDLINRLMRRSADLQHKIEDAGGYAVDHKIEAILHGLGFTDSQFGIKVGDLSGGQKGRLALAKLLLEAPDLLLLDEPTNHLDIAGREWLEEFLTGDFPGAVLMVSHDRYMLDNVVTKIEEVEQGRLIDYPGNYTAFCEIRGLRRLTQHRAYEKQQGKFRKEEEYIRRFKAGQRAKQAQGRLSKLDREKRDSTLERSGHGCPGCEQVVRESGGGQRGRRVENRPHQVRQGVVPRSGPDDLARRAVGGYRPQRRRKDDARAGHAGAGALEPGHGQTGRERDRRLLLPVAGTGG